jgi:hypothetical protein
MLAMADENFTNDYRYKATRLDSMGQQPDVAMLRMLQDIEEVNNARSKAVLIRLLGVYCQHNGISAEELEDFVSSASPLLVPVMFPDSVGASVIDTRKSTQVIGGDARAQGEEKDPWDWGLDDDADLSELNEIAGDEAEPF